MQMNISFFSWDCSERTGWSLWIL